MKKKKNIRKKKKDKKEKRKENHLTKRIRKNLKK